MSSPSKLALQRLQRVFAIHKFKIIVTETPIHRASRFDSGGFLEIQDLEKFCGLLH